ncbi:DUF2909 family protein [Colwellia sp. KU-HH00111]|uniref:DUF2909 domain-containing protein n=1 Tax=Colwellia sp. KU-HH00111 TaxID=3127652 RepID=UPI003104D7F6
MLFKIVIITLLLFMIYNLFRALLIMNKKPKDKINATDQTSMTKFIGRRLMLSVAIVIILVIGLLTGLITPNPRPY